MIQEVNSFMTILVTGATRGLGNLSLEHLKKLIPQQEIYGLARNKEKARLLEEEGINARIGTYDDPESLQKALNGIDHLLFVSSSELNNRQTQHKNVINAAQNAGVSYIVYTSFSNASQANTTLAYDHAYTEKIINDTGIAHTFLRNNWYLENETILLETALKTGKVVHAGGSGKAGWALKREFSELAARAVSGKFDFPSILEAGSSLITYKQLFEALEIVSGKTIQIIEGDNDDASKYLQDFAELPKEVSAMLVESQNIIRSGALEIGPTDIEKYLGKSMLSPSDALKELLELK